MGEGRAEPRTAYAVLYAPSRSVEEARAQRGATERSEFKKYFSFNFILTGFLFNNYKFVFLFWILGRGVRGECPKSKTPYSLQIKGKRKGFKGREFLPFICSLSDIKLFTSFFKCFFPAFKFQ